MISDRDREDLINDLRTHTDRWMLEEGKDRDRLIEFENAVRAESAEQARKEAADNAVAFMRDRLPSGFFTEIMLDEMYAASIGDSVVKENLITDHIPDTVKKLAIAVKALEEIRDVDIQHNKIARDALKEIQG